MIGAGAEMLRAALAYAARSVPVLPLDGKVPIGDLVPHGVHDATADTGKIRAWWGCKPLANVGLAMGYGRLVLDVDGLAGRRSLAELELEHGKLPTTLTAQTGSGGRHFVFAIDPAAKLRNAVGFRPGLDTRAAGGYIVAAPSLHESGERYRWLIKIQPATAPGWLLELVATPRQSDAPAAPQPITDVGVQRRIKRAAAYLQTMPASVSGQGGHAATFKAALALCRGFALDEATAFALLCEYNESSCFPRWSDKEIAHKIRSAANQARLPSGYLLAGRP